MYYCLAFVCLIVIHELGHLIAARSLGLKVYSVDISGFGGLCKCDSPRAIKDTFLVFSAGLLAQLFLFAITVLVVATFGYPTSSFGKCVVKTFLLWNVVLLVLNLIPHKEFDGILNDGAILWKLFLHATKGRPHPFPDPIATTRLFPPETRLLAIEGFKPAGFTTGVEILNNETTPMQFVVTVLMKHLKLSEEDAIQMMFAIHNNGGVLVSTRQASEAEALARSITDDAKDEGHRLVCRAVEA
jgi:ATP-dependent Clp protease adapter protein ClpS